MFLYCLASCRVSVETQCVHVLRDVVNFFLAFILLTFRFCLTICLQSFPKSLQKQTFWKSKYVAFVQITLLMLSVRLSLCDFRYWTLRRLRVTFVQTFTSHLSHRWKALSRTMRYVVLLSLAFFLPFYITVWCDNWLFLLFLLHAEAAPVFQHGSNLRAVWAWCECVWITWLVSTSDLTLPVISVCVLPVITSSSYHHSTYSAH